MVKHPLLIPWSGQAVSVGMHSTCFQIYTYYRLCFIFCHFTFIIHSNNMCSSFFQGRSWISHCSSMQGTSALLKVAQSSARMQRPRNVTGGSLYYQAAYASIFLMYVIDVLMTNFSVVCKTWNCDSNFFIMGHTDRPYDYWAAVQCWHRYWKCQACVFFDLVLTGSKITVFSHSWKHCSILSCQCWI